MKGYDLLLIYLSELGSGPWTRFRAAVQGSLGRTASGESDPTYRTRANLEALGHLEAAGDEANYWTVTRATLVQIPSKDGAAAVLAGARTHRLLELTKEEHFEISPQEYGPARYLIRADSARELKQVANRLAIEWSAKFCERLAKALPSTAEVYETARESKAPSGWTMQLFRNLDWVDARSDLDDGFYRYRHFTTEYRLKWEGSCRQLERSTGIYEYARRTGSLIVDYDESKETLRVPLTAGLPSLAERCAILCTGLLPSAEFPSGRGVLLYGGVQNRIGRLIRASLT